MLLYGARNPERLLYRAELQRWMARLDFQVELAVGSADRDWGGHIGVATSQLKYLDLDPGHTAALICSSERMMRSMIRELNHAGVPDERIFVSLERSMKCGMGMCGHCQLGPTVICKDGPVYRVDQVRGLMSIREAIRKGRRRGQKAQTKTGGVQVLLLRRLPAQPLGLRG